MALSLGGSTGPAQAQEEFKWGAVMPVTGPIPQYGEYFIRGSQLALEDLEKAGWIDGKKIRYDRGGWEERSQAFPGGHEQADQHR